MLRITIVILWVCILSDVSAQREIHTFSDDGAWCWFSDPRAVQEGDVIISGWVKRDGTVEAASLDLQHQTRNFATLYPELEVDDHDNPAFAILPDSRILAMYTWHSSKKGIIHQVTEKPLDVSTFSEPTVIRPGIDELLPKFPRETYTYANPFLLADEGEKVYSFGRWIGYKPNMIESDDDGESWHSPRVIISPEEFDPGNRPYVKYASDGKSRIDLVFTDGHPRVEPLNAVYHCYYEHGAYWRSDGSKICSLDELPFEPEEATPVYLPDSLSGRAWLADLGTDADGNLVILYTRHPEETDHYYHYTYYDTKQNSWVDHQICRAGGWFPQTQEGETEREPHYHGNLTLHPSRLNTIYLSREIDGVFEIEKRTTNDRGKTWKIESITENSEYDQVRPYVPRNAPPQGKTAVLWMENRKYIHYTNYDTAIKYVIEDIE